MSALRLDVTGTIAAGSSVWQSVVSLCRAAYDEDLGEILSSLRPSGHVLGWLDDELVSHACWVTRELAPGLLRRLRTAYVEAVATSPAQQRRGFASAVLKRLAQEVEDDFELAALSPSAPAFYERLGWQRWRGPLAIRATSGLIATPGEDVMILPLRRTPAIDFDSSLTAEWREGELW